jgi:hypothetical protein
MPVTRYCTYGHYLGSELIYIGSGTQSRPFTWNSRGTLWQKEVQGKVVDVVIYRWFTSSEEARTEEKKLLKTFSPKTNALHVGRKRSDYCEPRKRYWNPRRK